MVSERVLQARRQMADDEYRRSLGSVAAKDPRRPAIIYDYGPDDAGRRAERARWLWAFHRRHRAAHHGAFTRCQMITCRMAREIALAGLDA